MRQIFALWIAAYCSGAVAASPANDGAVAMDALYSTTAGFVGLVVLAGFIGALVSRALGKQRKAVREAVYAVCVLGGMVLAVLHYQGKLPL